MKRYLNKHGTHIINVEYYHEGHNATSDTDVWDLGVVTGEQQSRLWCFGHMNISTTIAGVIVLTNQMMLDLEFTTILPGVTEVGYVNHAMGVNLGMSLMGNGEYEGRSRLYGMGFNRVVTNTLGFGAATFIVRYCFNGYIFRIK